MDPEEIAALGPLVEADGDVGAFNPDGTVNVAIIRPCTSRGRRLNGLPPIYTQEMLAEEADAFTDWRMFMGHLTPEMARAMKKAGRSIEELGGRVTESWWNPDYVGRDDDKHGFESGAIMGKVIPYPAVKSLLEADPRALAVSINAWPKGAKPGTDSRGRQGMVIEGFRREPQGSVDWVISAGAGGGVAEEERAVSLLESIYDPANAPGGEHVKLSEMTEDEFRAHVAEHAPHLVDALAESDGGGNNGGGSLDEATVQEMLALVEERWNERQDELVEERANEIVAEREKQRGYADHAKGKIEKAEGLTDGHRADLLARYSVTDGKAAAGLLVESEADLDTAIDADVQHALNLIQESRPNPRVNGLGSGDGEEDKPKGKSSRGWTSHLQEMGAMPLDADGNPDTDRLLDGTVN